MNSNEMFNVTAEPTTSTDNVQHRSCQNCGVTGMTNGGICARCLELPYCRWCKRHLPEGCFGDEANLCLVRLQFQLYIFIVAFYCYDATDHHLTQSVVYSFSDVCQEMCKTTDTG